MPSTPIVLALRGLPGSGKSTVAKALLNGQHGNHWIRVNRDDLRKSLFDGEGILPYAKEEAITSIQRSIAKAAIKIGKNVVVDDCNLRNKYLTEWDKFARSNGAAFLTEAVNTAPIECVRRDAERRNKGGRYVGSEVIFNMADRYLRDGQIPDYIPPVEAKVDSALVEWDFDLPEAVLVDLDGTLAEMGTRKPYDWSRVGEDSVSEPVGYLVRMLQNRGTQVIFMSGRDSVCRDETWKWLYKHGFVKSGTRLYMRPEGDNRKDSVVKRELFDLHLRGEFNIRFVLDDRNQVVDMWRHELGLPTFQVAEGNF